MILRVALPVPLAQTFDYLAPIDAEPRQIKPGIRLKVPFGRSSRIGILLEIDSTSGLAPGRLKHAAAVLDDEPILGPRELSMIRWASGYYHCPIGEAAATALPGYLRQGNPAEIKRPPRWRLTASAAAPAPRAPRQAALMAYLSTCPDGADADSLNRNVSNWRGAMGALISKGWAEQMASAQAAVAVPAPAELRLNAEQQNAVDTILAAIGGFRTFLLDGVTGSGKTEVYLRVIEQVVGNRRQVLVLIPEIGLTKQTIARFRARFDLPLAILHSGRNAQERSNAWLQARAGTARFVIGTRSAVWTPLPELGLIIVDEEHDLSYKQQDGFRYSARDVAIRRAQQTDVPIVLGTATPSLESLYNVTKQRYVCLRLPERAGAAKPPTMQLLDLRSHQQTTGLSAALLARIEAELKQNRQILVFINRRGYAPLVLCHGCGWTAECSDCDAHMTYHQSTRRLCCHHCGGERPLPALCPVCHGKQIVQRGYGTQRIVETLTNLHPTAKILRIDRDTTRAKGAIDTLLEQIDQGNADILVGTQMLSKGHHFPRVSLVAIIDADHRLFSVDFRAPERLAQLIVQVAGRAGRADVPGTVLIQTHHPRHPLLCTLLERGYHQFCRNALSERKAAGLPPFAAMAVLRADSLYPERSKQFLQLARSEGESCGGAVAIYGPIAAPMERRATRYRAQLLIHARRRAALQQMLERWLPRVYALPGRSELRVSLDVDPQETL